MKLHLADTLALPSDEAVSQKYAFLGRSGSGKTYGAMKLAELFLGAEAQIIALDWVGNWWALRLAADGKSPGFENVYIFGGEHADVPLEATAGAMIADLLVDKHLSAVLDLSPFRKHERTRFATAFAEQLFHRKKTARTACHLFLEEAQAFLPQLVRGDDARMVGVFEDIGKVGRNYGIGVSILSQRPQAVNKDVLNQTEVLLAFQTNGPQERKTIGGWVVEHGDADVALVNELPSLDRGDAFVWSPQWLQVRKRIHVAARVTYDASSTPTQRAKQVKPKALTPADIQALGEAMKATVERAKADDPRELRKQVATLQRELATARKEKPAPAPTIERIEVPVVSEAELKRLADVAHDLHVQVLHLSTEFSAQTAGVLEAIQALTRSAHPIQTRHETPQRRSNPPAVERPGRVVRPATAGGADVSPARQRILNALAFFDGIGIAPVDKTQLALMVGVSPTSGGYFNNLGALRSSDLVRYPSGGTVVLTDAGAALASTDGIPSTTDELHDAIRAKLPPAKWRILEVLIQSYPKAVSKDDLAATIDVSPTSGGYFNNLGSLRSLGLVEYPRPGQVAARSILFLE